jgi:hypothetical protein
LHEYPKETRVKLSEDLMEPPKENKLQFNFKNLRLEYLKTKPGYKVLKDHLYSAMIPLQVDHLLKAG